MSGFDKIDFNVLKKQSKNTKQTRDYAKQPAGAGMPTRSKKNKIKIPKKAIIIAVIVIALLFGAVGVPAYATYKSGLKAYRSAKVFYTALKQQDIAAASTALEQTKKDLAETQKNFHFLLPLKFVPIVNFYYNDADHLMNAGAYSLDTARTTINAIEPYADILGLHGQGSFAAGSAQDRLKTAILTASKITPKIDEIADSLTKVQSEMDKVDPNHYPTFLFGKKIKPQLTQVKTLVDQAGTFVTDARPLVKVLPDLLGASEPQKYLVLFQNDKELRPTGGFLTGYAILRIDNGSLNFEKSDDIYVLDNSIPNKQRAPEPILKYFKGVSTFNLRDSNLSPDFVESMKTFMTMYNKAGQKENVNGIIALDTNVLVQAIKILDDQIAVDGTTFTTKNDPRCECPQVIYALEDNISRPVNYVKTDRKALLGDMLGALMSKALSSSPKIYWGPLFQMFLTQSNQKHVMFYVFNNDAQTGIEALNAAGRIKEFEGDYLHINESNFSGAKVNIFMQEGVDNAYKVEGDGTITKTVTVHYKNPFPASDCNLERGGLCLNAQYRDWIRVYVPKGSKLVDSKGSTTKLVTSDDLGKTVFEGLVSVRPQGVGTFSVTYTLPFKTPNNGELPVLIQKQPGTYDNQYKMIVNDQTKEEFPLLTDKQLELRIR
jgi:hypothetical protein